MYIVRIEWRKRKENRSGNINEKETAVAAAAVAEIRIRTSNICHLYGIAMACSWLAMNEFPHFECVRYGAHFIMNAA